MKIQKYLLIAILLTAAFSFGIFAQTGGIYDLSHNVISGGGEGSANAAANYRLDGTLGQAIAGTTSTGALYNLHGGFWFGQPLAPTAAAVTITGRILNTDGGFARRVTVILTDSATGEIRSARPSAFGFYRFEDIPVGRIYTVRAESKNFLFTPDSYVFSLVDARDDLDFTAVPVE